MIILTEDKLTEAVKYFMTQPGFAFDIESVPPGGMDDASRGYPHVNTVTWMSMANDKATIVIPMGHPIGTKIIGTKKSEPIPYKKGTSREGKTYRRNIPVYEAPPLQMSRGNVFEITRPLFFDPNIIKVAHNATFDLASVAKYFDGIPPLPPFDDTIVDAWLCDENKHRYGLKYLVKDMFRLGYDDENVGKCVEKHPFGTVAYYSYLDARYDWLLYRRLQPRLAAMALGPVHRLESEMIQVLVDMRLTGTRVDEPRLTELKAELTDRLEEIKGRIYQAAGRSFNINSTQQKRDLLFSSKKEGGQGLRSWKKTDTGLASTDDEVLASYPGNPLAAALREYSDTSKLLGTYVVGYLGDPAIPDKKPRRIYEERVHADFVQYGTVSGRFSCREPNLQNIPRPDTELGKIIRSIWLADDDCRLVVADYSQIELVILAHYLGEGKLFDGFLAGIDPHRMTAAMVLGKDPADITKDERQYLGKTLGFATVYGAGAKKVASMMTERAGRTVEVEEASAVLQKHQQMFPEIYGFRDWLIRETRKTGELRTLSGRVRRLPTINSRDSDLRQYAERQAFNSLIQGGAADVQKMAMLRAYQDPRRPPEIRMLMTVHDEIILSAPEPSTPLAEDILREAMTGDEIQSLIRVPLKIDIHTVQRWNEAK